MQLNLAFLDLPSPARVAWEQLDEEQRAAVLAILARLLAQAVAPQPSAQERHDD